MVCALETGLYARIFARMNYREPVTVIWTLTQKSGLNNHYLPPETFPKYMVHKRCVLNGDLMRVNSVSTQSRTEESELEYIPKAISEVPDAS